MAPHCASCGALADSLAEPWGGETCCDCLIAQIKRTLAGGHGSSHRRPSRRVGPGLLLRGTRQVTRKTV